MKLDPVIHIVMHSVFLLKPGVTSSEMNVREFKSDRVESRRDVIYVMCAAVKCDVLRGVDNFYTKE